MIQKVSVLVVESSILLTDPLNGSVQLVVVPSDSNVVSSILACYRGYDTFGETIVIYTAGIAVLILLQNNISKDKIKRKKGK